MMALVLNWIICVHIGSFLPGRRLILDSGVEAPCHPTPSTWDGKNQVANIFHLEIANQKKKRWGGKVDNGRGSVGGGAEPVGGRLSKVRTSKTTIQTTR